MKVHTGVRNLKKFFFAGLTVKKMCKHKKIACNVNGKEKESQMGNQKEKVYNKSTVYT